MISSEFFYTTCAYGAETALKNEVLRLNPKIKPGFFKKGFLTFHYPGQLEGDFHLDIVFARSYGLSYQLIKIVDQNYKELEREISFLQKKLGASALVHVFKRERYKTAEKIDQALVDQVKLWREKFSDGVLKNNTPVIDVVFLEENEVFLGWHLHHHDHSEFIGGDPEMVLPSEAPSRAYLKIAEACLRIKPDIGADDIVMDVGCSPGGASFFFLKNGLNVLGVDSAEMDPKVLAFKKPWFRHVRKPIGNIASDEIVPGISWVAVDMNVKPPILILELKKLVPKLKDVRGLFLTLKMPDVKSYEEIPQYLKQIKKLGFTKIKPIQLVSNKQEIFVYAEK